MRIGYQCSCHNYSVGCAIMYVLLSEKSNHFVCTTGRINVRMCAAKYTTQKTPPQPHDQLEPTPVRMELQLPGRRPLKF